MKFVVWHKNPDTDSFCSSVVYAHYLNEIHENTEFALPVSLGKANKETEFVFKQVGMNLPTIQEELPEWAEIILVDHNEAAQSIDNRGRYVIDEVVDHHKIADFETSWPVAMRFEKVWCTCTVLAEMFLDKVYVPDRPIAVLMIAAIISDTLYFRSQTTTQRDKDAVQWLNEIWQIDDLEKFSLEMFDAKSDIEEFSEEELVEMDFKIYDLSGQNMWVWVLETTNPDFVLDRKEDIIDAIHDVKDKHGLKQLMFCVVDILNEHTIAFVVSDTEKEIIEWAFWVAVMDGFADLGNRVSRKKTMIPPIADWFAAQ